MKTALWQTGKTSFSYLNEGIDIYKKRLKHYLTFEVKTFPDIKKAKNYSEGQLKELESNQILKVLNTGDFLILLDERGKMHASEKFAAYLEKQMMQSHRRIIFLIGGAYGFSEALYKRANAKISLSPMTFSHQMVRLLFLEQLYRAMTILKNEPYHHR